MNDQGREQVIQALGNIWQADPGVRQFGLQYFPERAQYEYGAWIVPVASGVTTGSAHELAAALSRIQASAEKQANAEITLYLDPFVKQR